MAEEDEEEIQELAGVRVLAEETAEEKIFQESELAIEEVTPGDIDTGLRVQEG
jgi:hypothetical protein